MSDVSTHPAKRRPPARPAGMPAWGWAAGAIVILVAAYWITLPPERVALDKQCRPEDLAASLSAGLYGDGFWRSQQAALANEIQILSGAPAAGERARDQQQAGAIEKKMDRLSNPESAGDAADQEKALVEEQRQRMARMAELVGCQGPVAQHLAARN